MPKRKPTHSTDSDGDGDGASAGKGKKIKAVKAVKDDGKEEFWEWNTVGGEARVGVGEFKGVVMVSVREFYERGGERLPGKKGISLPIEQFNTLIQLLPRIEAALVRKGQSVERPDYSGEGASVAVGEEGEKEGKKNFEETSDEG